MYFNAYTAFNTNKSYYDNQFTYPHLSNWISTKSKPYQLLDLFPTPVIHTPT